MRRLVRRPSASELVVADMAIAALLVGLALSHALGRPQQAVALALMTGSVALRRLRPLLAFAILLAGWTWQLRTGSNWPTWSAGAALAAVLLATYSVGAHTRRLWGGVIVIAAAALVAGRSSHSGTLPVPAPLVPALLIGAVWIAGRAIRIRQLAAASWESHATRLEREQAAAEKAALERERTYIARELHDIVTHAVSLMVIQAGAARQVLDHPDRAAKAMLAVETSGRDALNELRRLLDLLANVEDRAPLTPRPGLTELTGLVERAVAAGLPITVTVRGTKRPLPAGLDLAAYRIIQEAITNSMKHSALTATTLSLDYRERELAIEVTDRGPAPSATGMNGSGHGLIGMRERAQIYGGRVDASSQSDRGYRVHVSLPLEPLP